MRKLRALIIFDDEHLRQGVRDILELEDYDVCARSDVQHLDLVRDYFRPDVAVAWVYYSQSSYHTTLRDLVMCHVPTLFISSFSCESYQQYYVSFKHNLDFFTAPFDAGEMVSVLYHFTRELRVDLKFMNLIDSERIV